MICKKCSLAADLIAEARSTNPHEQMIVRSVVEEHEMWSVSIAESMKSLGGILHCNRNSNCDCQHIIDFEGSKTINGR